MSNYITITNGTTSQAITITQTFAKNDVLEVDCDNKTVKVNGTEVDYTGVFPIFSPGTHNLVITTDFTVFTFTVTTDYTKRYL